MSKRNEALAERLEQGALELANFAKTLAEAEWQSRLPKDGRTLGVIVHHVASVYPVEIHLAQTIASGRPIVDVTSAVIDRMNAEHAKTFANVTRAETLELLARNSAAAAAAIRALSDEDLDRAGPISFYEGAPLTTQFMLEDHAVRHSYHHLALLRAGLKQLARAA
jgi:hypothetical protein